MPNFCKRRSLKKKSFKKRYLHVQNVSNAVFLLQLQKFTSFNINVFFLFFSCFIRFIKIFKPKELDSTHKWTIRFKYRGK